MKFNTIIGNPPYQGNKQLHQQFFNAMTEEHLIAEGLLCFIQPAIAYFNKKKPQRHTEAMQETIKRWTTRVVFKDASTCFEGIGIFNGLAVSVLHKVEGNGRVASVTYLDGTTYEDIELKDVNMLGMEPELWARLRAKYLAYIEKHGSLIDIVAKKGKGAYIQAIRGNINEPDLHTLVSDNKKYHTAHAGDNGMCVCIPESQFDNFYTYAATFVARFGLALLKFDQNGHFAAVPLVSFDRAWTDEALAELIGLTDEELAVIRSVLPDYHNLLGQTSSHLWSN